MRESQEIAQDAARVAIEHLDPEHVTSLNDLKKRLEYCLERVEGLRKPPLPGTSL